MPIFRLLNWYSKERQGQLM